MKEQDFLSVVSKLVEIIDGETNNHVECVAKISRILASGLPGLTSRNIEVLYTAALLHDIGKAGIGDSIIRKQGKLTEEEFTIVKTHTTIGGKMLSGSKSEILQTAEIVALQHHEKWDGSGYPSGLIGKNIHLFGRIIAIADVFEALVNERPYKKAWAVADAVDYIITRSGTQFDPELVAIFKDKHEEIVQLIGEKDASI